MSVLSKAMSAFNKPAPQSKPEPETKRWACSYIDWSDHELSIKFASATNWLEAFMTAYPNRYANITNADGGPPETLEKAKKNAFNTDSMIHVEEIPNE